MVYRIAKSANEILHTLREIEINRGITTSAVLKQY